MTAPLLIAAQSPGPDEIDTLYRAAFPEEMLSALVHALLAMPDGVLSLTARRNGALQGHALFTICGVEHGPEVALLGPVAVAPDQQRRGVGAALITSGLARLEDGEAARVLVLGDPGYYARYGFKPERAIRPAHPIPAQWSQAWRSLTLKPGEASGRLIPPEPWDDPALWT